MTSSAAKTSSAAAVPCAAQLPQKRYYRQRAHSNPMADHCFDYPVSPHQMQWSPGLYPATRDDEDPLVRFADIGCGYGGLLVALAPMFPRKRMLGMEIRVKVSDYVRDRIRALRQQAEAASSDSEGGHGHGHHYRNIACLRSNAMKYLPNFFRPGQLEKMFFLFPDPHFKKAKHKWRIINETLLAEYAYVLAVGGRVYTVTDVEDLGVWMTTHLARHPLFRRLSDEEQSADPVVEKLFESTEEGQKVSRADGQKWCAVFERVADLHPNAEPDSGTSS